MGIDIPAEKLVLLGPQDLLSSPGPGCASMSPSEVDTESPEPWGCSPHTPHGPRPGRKPRGRKMSGEGRGPAPPAQKEEAHVGEEVTGGPPPQLGSGGGVKRSKTCKSLVVI
jgi:hypothetical protein